MSAMREKIAWSVAAALGLLVIAAFSGIIEGGPLDPTGAPGPTMKTLQEVEPRRTVQSLATNATGQYLINQSGSYYLTANITGIAGKNGIEVSTSNVTIDLNGFTMSGVAGSLDGIFVLGGRTSVSVRNGILRNWGGDGLDASGAIQGHFEDLIAENNTGYGLRIGHAAGLTDCEAKDNAVDGIETGTNSSVSDCVAYSNTGAGIRLGEASVLTNCAARVNGGDGIVGAGRALITECTSSQNSGDGIEVIGSASITNNVASQNGSGASDGAGIHATSNLSRIVGNVVTGNDRGIDVDLQGNLIANNMAGLNTTEYDVVANNLIGPILLHTDVATATNPFANFEN